SWMPVMFTFLLANFAVGLVIYWAWNNVLSVLQQYTIMRKNGAEIHLWRNMGVDGLIARLRSGQGTGAGDIFGKGSAGLRRGAEKLGQYVSGLKQLAASPGQSGSSPSSTEAKGHGASDPAGSSASTDMTREQALKTLGLEPGATPSEIDDAYRRHTRKN